LYEYDSNVRALTQLAGYEKGDCSLCSVIK